MDVCETNRKLLDAVLLNLNEISKLSSAEAEARKHGNLKLATELDQRLDEAIAQKVFTVGAWQEHVGEHGCHEFERHT